MKITKTHKFLVLTVVIIALLAYLYLTGFHLVKSLFGYDISPRKGMELNNSGVDFLKAPAGFRISVFAENLSKPGIITFDPKGRMFVSEPQEGKVIRIDAKNGTAGNKTTILEGLRSPYGLAFYTDSKKNITYLYVAETHQVARYVYDVKNGNISESDKKQPENIVTLPSDGGENPMRTIAFGPNYRVKPITQGKLESESMVDDKLYVGVGSSCNVCVEDSWKKAAILESDPGGTYTAEFAGGLRDSVFFTFHPVTKEIWATEISRDGLGNNLPPDEINIIRIAGPQDEYGAKRFGWPFCYGDRIKDKTFNPTKINRVDIPQDCSQTEPPTIEIPAHSAPLGLAFITSDKWPKEWQDYLLVTYHNPSNQSTPGGYKMVLYKLGKRGDVIKSADGKPEVEDFITGWLDGKNTLGRPLDLKFGPDGALYISDDFAGVIYRVTYE